MPAERIRVVGNPVHRRARAAASSGGRRRERSGVVLTAHRATNVDDPERLEQLVELILRLAARWAR